MINIKSLRWSNWFSYGDDNFIDFYKEPIVQIKGQNGSGKSSIAIILQEVLFGKNIKGIKKEDLSNRYTKVKTTRAELQFSISSKHYVLVYERSSKLKLILTCEGVDLSGHTTAQTYKKLTDLLGLDFQLFSTLIYQSSDCRLSFLTDTDTNRKKFLINLLNLSEYLDNQKIFKNKSKEVLDNFNTLTGRLEGLKSTIEELKDKDFTATPNVPVPVIADNNIIEKAKIEKEILSIDSVNEKIAYNNKLLKDISKLENNLGVPKEPIDIGNLDEELNALRVAVGKHLADKAIAVKSLKTISDLGSYCPTCTQVLLTDQVNKLKNTFISNRDSSDKLIAEKTAKANNIKTTLKKAAEINKHNELIRTNSQDIANKQKALTTKNEESPVDVVALKEALQLVTTRITKLSNSIKIAITKNKEIDTRNTRLEAQSAQLKKASESILEVELLLKKEKQLLDNCLILEESFSMKGLIGYKIEHIVKNFEAEINNYLLSLSDGKLLLQFKVQGDKLNVVINSNSSSVGINSLSAGELARVNCATLLAIRKLLTPINILFLDEIAGVLDDSGKESLIHVLGNENINCFLVDHTFTHPLVPYIEVVKENNLARII